MVVVVSSFRFVCDLYPALEVLFSFDPLLLKVFIECCPLKDVPDLCQRICPSLCMQWLSYYVKQPTALESVPTDKVNDYSLNGMQ